MSPWATTVLAASAILCGALQAQANAPGCAAAVAEHLGFLVGEWDVHAVFRNQHMWDTTAADVSIQPELGGCVLREEVVGERFGQPFRTLSLWGAVGLQAPIQRTFVHSQHGLLTVFSGNRTAAGLALRDSHVVNGAVVLLEHRFEPFDADSMRFTSRRSTDKGISWRVTWFADYRRRRS